MVRYIKESIEDDFDKFDFGGEWVVDIPKECIKGATLLSIEEYEKYKDNIPKIRNWQWLRSPGYHSNLATLAYGDGSVDCDGYDVDQIDFDVRPALILNLQPSNLDAGAGDKFEFGEHLFTILSNDLAICGGSIGEGCFREDENEPDANVYEKSDVKKFVDNWFNEAYRNYEG